jgi:type I restriction enzyme, S subunit
MSWPDVKIKDVCLLTVDCVNKTAPVVDYETPFKMIRTSNVRGGFVDTKNVRYVTEETFGKWTRRSRPIAGDVILTREAPLGDVGRMTVDDNIFLGQRLFQYRADLQKLDSKFLAYVLQSPLVQGRIKSKGFGATVEHARVGDFENLEIPLRPLDIQKKIGNTLAAYDDLIENNRRRIQLLEESARLLYQEWFVHLRFPFHAMNMPRLLMVCRRDGSERLLVARLMNGTISI